MWLNDERGMESLASPKKCGAGRRGAEGRRRGVERRSRGVERRRRGVERRRRGVEGRGRGERRRFVCAADKKQPGRGAAVGAEEFRAGERADVAIARVLE